MTKKILSTVMLPLLLCFFCFGCNEPKQEVVEKPLVKPAETTAVVEEKKEESPITKITLIQMNDVYEMDPVNGGTEGGLARVASLRDKLLEKNPNTITLLAGDLFSPSALGTAPYQGARLDGRQMVAAMNSLGLDYIAFGNHEFDLKKESFYDRLKESEFKWIGSNAFADDQGTRFLGVGDTVIFEVEGVKIGIFSVVLKKNFKEYVYYEDPLIVSQKKVNELRPQVDILIALTHLTIQEDLWLAKNVPGIDILLGGHEHENMQYWRGQNYTPVFKADANARTVYIHDLTYNKKEKKLVSIYSNLQKITPALPDQEKTAKVIDTWREIGYEGFRQDGFEPTKLVTTTNVELDGTEASVRNATTTLTSLIADSLITVSEGAQVSFYNGGSIRIDDSLPPGKISEYDVIRILPFGGDIVTTKMKGSLLKKAFDQGMKNQGSGAFLQKGNVSGGAGTPWLIGGKEINENEVYFVATTEFLLTVGDDNLEFLVNNPEVPILENMGDMRKALIQQLQKTFGTPE